MMRRFGAAFGAGALLAACSTPVDGTASRHQATGLQQVLPSPEQVEWSVGNRLEPTGPGAVGSIDLLPNGIRDAEEVTPLECLGAATPLMRQVYQKGDVSGVGLRDFARFGEAMAVSSVHTGVVRFRSDAEAMRMFNTFVAQWRSCNGTSVSVHVTPKSALVWTVTDVNLDGPVLSATILNGETEGEPAFPTEHAVGVAADCIVDVDVAVTASQPERRVAAGRAVDLVRRMLENINAEL